MTQYLLYRDALYRLAEVAVQRVLHELLMGFMESGNYRLVCDINQGDCLDFAEAGVEKLRRQGVDAEFRHSTWIVEQVVKQRYGLDPDDDSWEDYDFEYGLPVHAWIEVAGKCYDAEAIQGVDRWWELPLFQRYFKRHPKDQRVFVQL